MNKEFDSCLKESITKKVSAVINPIDDFTEERPIGKIKIVLEGLAVKPVKNPGGFYVFVKLLPGSYRFTIESEYYIPSGGELIVPQSDETPHIVEAKLIPAVSYPFSPDCTLVRGTVSDKNGNAIGGALIRAGILPGSQRILKLGKVNSINGNTMEIVLDNMLNSVERFNILKVGTGGNTEVCKVRDILKKEADLESILLQDTPVNSKKGHDVYLMEVDEQETRSNMNGEFVLYFRSFYESTLNVKIETSFRDKTFISLVDGKEQDVLTVKESETTVIKVGEKQL